jgi:hypothetical protein
VGSSPVAADVCGSPVIGTLSVQPEEGGSVGVQRPTGLRAVCRRKRGKD